MEKLRSTLLLPVLLAFASFPAAAQSNDVRPGVRIEAPPWKSAEPLYDTKEAPPNEADIIAPVPIPAPEARQAPNSMAAPDANAPKPKAKKPARKPVSSSLNSSDNDRRQLEREAIDQGRYEQQLQTDATRRLESEQRVIENEQFLLEQQQQRANNERLRLQFEADRLRVLGLTPAPGPLIVPH